MLRRARKYKGIEQLLNWHSTYVAKWVWLTKRVEPIVLAHYSEWESPDEHVGTVMPISCLGWLILSKALAPLPALVLLARTGEAQFYTTAGWFCAGKIVDKKHFEVIY
jgi:hypothetical protein